MVIKTRFGVSVTLSILASLLIGCASSGDKSGEKVPRFAPSVKVARYDSTIREVKPGFQVVTESQLTGRKYRVIALLTRHAKPEDEALIMEAIAWQAKAMGADAMVALPPVGRGESLTVVGKFASAGQEQPIYRAHAIVFE